MSASPADPFIRFAHRASDSPFVHSVWTAESTVGGNFSSVAYPQSELVITHLDDEVTVSIRGPETRATRAACPPDGTWVGIRLLTGVRLTPLDLATGVDGGVTFSTTARGRFTMCCELLEVPTADDAEAFVSKLMRLGFLVRDPLVRDVLAGTRPGADARTVQRRFVGATGLSQQTIRGIERAHRATFMLRGHASIADTVDALGFADQSHLTRTLRRLIGVTPAQVAATDTSHLSFMPPLEARELRG